MTATPAFTTTLRRASLGAGVVAAVAFASTMAAPAALAAPVSPALLLTKSEFPAGSSQYETGAAPKGRVTLKPGAPPQCAAAADRLNRATAGASGVSASAINGYSYLQVDITSPVQASLWRTMTAQCDGPESALEVPADLKPFRPAVVTYYTGKRNSAIEGAADVGNVTVDVYVRGLDETPANTSRFWELFRAQIKKVQTGR